MKSELAIQPKLGFSLHYNRRIFSKNNWLVIASGIGTLNSKPIRDFLNWCAKHNLQAIMNEEDYEVDINVYIDDLETVRKFRRDWNPVEATLPHATKIELSPGILMIARRSIFGRPYWAVDVSHFGHPLNAQLMAIGNWLQNRAEDVVYREAGGVITYTARITQNEAAREFAHRWSLTGREGDPLRFGNLEQAKGFEPS
jgi:hypothetical protein